MRPLVKLALLERNILPNRPGEIRPAEIAVGKDHLAHLGADKGRFGKLHFPKPEIVKHAVGEVAAVRFTLRQPRLLPRRPLKGRVLQSQPHPAELLETAIVETRAAKVKRPFAWAPDDIFLKLHSRKILLPQVVEFFELIVAKLEFAMISLGLPQLLNQRRAALPLPLFALLFQLGKFLVARRRQAPGFRPGASRQQPQFATRRRSFLEANRQGSDIQFGVSPLADLRSKRLPQSRLALIHGAVGAVTVGAGVFELGPASLAGQPHPHVIVGQLRLHEHRDLLGLLRRIAQLPHRRAQRRRDRFFQRQVTSRNDVRPVEFGLQHVGVLKIRSIQFTVQELGAAQQRPRERRLGQIALFETNSPAIAAAEIHSLHLALAKHRS